MRAHLAGTNTQAVIGAQLSHTFGGYLLGAAPHQVPNFAAKISRATAASTLFVPVAVFVILPCCWLIVAPNFYPARFLGALIEFF